MRRRRRPRAALLSHSSFGASQAPSAKKMRDALKLIRAKAPDLMVDGEMHADSALNPELRARVLPHSILEGEANLLVFPNLDAANITLNAVKSMTDALHVGPGDLAGLLPPVLDRPQLRLRPLDVGHGQDLLRLRQEGFLHLEVGAVGLVLLGGDAVLGLEERVLRGAEALPQGVVVGP